MADKKIEQVQKEAMATIEKKAATTTSPMDMLR